MHKFIKRLTLAAVLITSANMAIAEKAEMPAPDSFKAGDKWSGGKSITAPSWRKLEEPARWLRSMASACFLTEQ